MHRTVASFSDASEITIVISLKEYWVLLFVLQKETILKSLTAQSIKTDLYFSHSTKYRDPLVYLLLDGRTDGRTDKCFIQQQQTCTVHAQSHSLQDTRNIIINLMVGIPSGARRC